MSSAGQPVAPVPGSTPTERIIIAAPPRRSAWSILLFFILFGGLGLFSLLLFVGAIAALTDGGGADRVTEQYHSLSKTAKDKIAVISVEGTILDGEGFVKKQIDHVRDDEDVQAVVLRVNSPGGTVTASDYLYHHLRKLAEERHIPIVVSMGGLAASGGYYVSMAVGNEKDVIFAEPTTWTGSIGVIIPHYNVAGLMKSWDIEDDSIKSGPLKQMGTITRQMTAEERKIFEDLVASSFHRFQDVVKYGRPGLAADPAALDRVSTGRIFTTEEALAAGLVDREGFIEAAIGRAIELAHLDRDQTRVVKYKKSENLLGALLSSEARRSPDLAALVDLSSPRAYYLCTWLPSAL